MAQNMKQEQTSKPDNHREQSPIHTHCLESPSSCDSEICQQAREPSLEPVPPDHDVRDLVLLVLSATSINWLLSPSSRPQGLLATPVHPAHLPFYRRALLYARQPRTLFLFMCLAGIVLGGVIEYARRTGDRAVLYSRQTLWLVLATWIVSVSIVYFEGWVDVYMENWMVDAVERKSRRAREGNGSKMARMAMVVRDMTETKITDAVIFREPLGIGSVC